MKSALINGALLALTLVVCLGLAELALSLLYPAPGLYTHFVWRPGMETVFRPKPGVMPGVSGDSRFSVNSMGVRAGEIEPGTRYRIVAFGGSTTECLFLDDSEAWPHLVEANLTEKTGRPVWVGNAGKSGANMREHRLQVGPLLGQFQNIDVALLMAGVNDLLYRLAAGKEYTKESRDTPEEMARRQLKGFAKIVKEKPEELPWHKRRALYRLFETAKAAWEARQKAAEGTKNQAMVQDGAGKAYEWARDLRKARPKVAELPDMTEALREFEENLDYFIDVAQEKGVTPVLLTQAFLWRADMPEEERALLWLGGADNIKSRQYPRYYTAKALAEGMAAFNAATLKVCQKRQITCIDMAAKTPQRLDLFYDGVHFSEEGARHVARVIADELEHNRIVPR